MIPVLVRPLIVWDYDGDFFGFVFDQSAFSGISIKSFTLLADLISISGLPISLKFSLVNSTVVSRVLRGVEYLLHEVPGSNPVSLAYVVISLEGEVLAGCDDPSEPPS